MITKERQVAIVRAIGRGVAHCSHYMTLNKRIVPFVQKQLASLIPAQNPARACDGWSVYVETTPGTYFLRTKYEIKVWGGVYGTPERVSHNDAVCLSWRKESSEETWYDGFLRELACLDVSDILEREVQEETLLPAIIHTDIRIQKLQAELREERERACALFATLQEPPSATARKGDGVWKEPTEKMKERFPRVFKGGE